VDYLKNARRLEHIVAMLPQDKQEGMRNIIRTDIERIRQNSQMEPRLRQEVINRLLTEINILAGEHRRGLSFYQQFQSGYHEPGQAETLASAQPARGLEDETDFIIASTNKAAGPDVTGVLEESRKKVGSIEDQATATADSRGPTTPGGIDFRNLPIVTQAISNLGSGIGAPSAGKLRRR
jgi:hypothetical protein